MGLMPIDFEIEYILNGKNMSLSTDILWRVFHILMEPVPYLS